MHFVRPNFGLLNYWAYFRLWAINKETREEVSICSQENDHQEDAQLEPDILWSKRMGRNQEAHSDVNEVGKEVAQVEKVAEAVTGIVESSL